MADVNGILAKAKAIKNGDGQNDGHNRSRSAFACGIIGGVVGLMVGYSQKWNMFYSAIGGILLGSVVATVLTPES